MFPIKSYNNNNNNNNNNTSNNNNIFGCENSMRNKDYKLTAGVTFTCQNTEANDHPVSIGVVFGQKCSPQLVLIILTGITDSSQ